MDFIACGPESYGQFGVGLRCMPTAVDDDDSGFGSSHWVLVC